MLLSMDEQSVKNRVKELVGLRASPRLAACQEIVWTMLPFGEFGGQEVRERAGLSFIFNEKTLNRALQSLQKAGLVIDTERHAKRLGGGRIFRLDAKLLNTRQA